MTFPLLSTVLFLPLVGALILLGFPRERENAIRLCAMIVMALTFAVSVVLFVLFDSALPQMQWVERAAWSTSLGIHYHVGVDGISLPLVLLTTLLTPITFLQAWQSIEIKVKEFAILMLVLETGMLGVFLALDMFLFFVFWEVILVPMYFLIGVWGGALRYQAMIKFLLYTMAGSALMLVAIIALHFLNLNPAYGGTGEPSFYLFDFYRLKLPLGWQKLMFGAFFLAFAIKVPLFPFHTWLPLAHVEAPTAGSVILAGVLLKMGTYGLLRFCLPIFPQAADIYAPLISTLAVIGIIYGALVAMVQPDVKKLVAYSSVSHLGFVVLGIFSGTMAGIQGSVLQMVSHGLSTGALFLLIGMIYDRRHTREIAEFGGLWKIMPMFAVFFLVAMFSSIGLPGLNGFVGEFLILLGTFEANRIFAVLAAIGIILGAVYMLWMYQRVMYGEVTNDANQYLRDMNGREIALMIPIVVLMFWIGIYPSTFLRKMDQSSAHLIEQIHAQRMLAESPVRIDVQIPDSNK
jgi:NADH-quinone oxidoreductase subunit M